MHMKELQKETSNIIKQANFLQKKESRFFDLIEEVGELAKDIMYYEGWKKGKFSNRIARKDIADSLSDVLFDIFALADLYNLDLEKEYQKMIKRLKKRVTRGEFKN